MLSNFFGKRPKDEGSSDEAKPKVENPTPQAPEPAKQRDHVGGDSRQRDEVFSKRVLAGKRTYFFDVKSTRSGEDYFVTITESKRVGERRYEKHKIFLYKEDFGKFVAAMHETVGFIKEDLLPDYDFRGLPELTKPEDLEDLD